MKETMFDYSNIVDLDEACQVLLSKDNWTILTHHYPDGDTIGSAYALGLGLKQLGKTVQVICADMIPQKYDYLTEAVKWDSFEPDNLCAVDVADPNLLGEGLLLYAPRIELCIDHHASNTHYAKQLLYKNYAAAAMLVYEVLKKMGVTITRSIAEGLYTGIATDTGCFRYNNTDALAHRMTAELLEIGIDMNRINRAMFDVKSRSRLELEQMAISGIRFDWNGRSAIMAITNDMLEKTSVDSRDLEGLASLPRQIEGVWVGVTMREIEDGQFKTSIRTGPSVNACDIAQPLGGGGHAGAAGCTLDGPLDAAIEQVLNSIRSAVPDIEKGI